MGRRKGWIAGVASLLVVLGAVCGAPRCLSAGEQKSYTVAVVPRHPPLVIERDWTPLLLRLSAASGYQLVLKFYKSFADFEREVTKGIPDFVFLNPYHAAVAKKSRGYVPLVRDDEQPLVGILVVKKDGAITSVQDLNGKEIVFPAPNAFAASLYIRSLLTQRERVRFTPKYVGTHSNVYRHVVLGFALAGGGVAGTLQRESPELRNELRVIYETPGVQPHPLCAHPRVPAVVREAVTNAVLRFAPDDEGRALLRAVRIPRPVRAEYERDYAMLEHLELERYIIKGRD